MYRATASWAFLTVFAWLSLQASFAQETPSIKRIEIQNARPLLRLAPFPAAERFKVMRTDNLNEPFREEPAGLFSGYDWTAPLNSSLSSGFYKLEVETIKPKDTLTAIVLSRLAYGPTPDELDCVNAMGPDAYIDEQLAPERIEENLSLDDETPTDSGWRLITATGTGSSSTLYVYLTLPGEGFIDDLKLVRGTVPESGPNLLRNGDFEAPLAAADWTVAENHSASTIVTDVKHSGNAALRLVASSGGSTSSSAIVQTITPALSASQTYTLSFWYLPSATQRSALVVRLSGRGIEAMSESLMSRIRYGLASIDDLHDWYTMHAVRSKRQLLEVMTQFVDNHFTTFYPKSRDYINGRINTDIEAFIATEFEYRELQQWRDVLMNPNGTFFDLLKISAESPSMIIYLDTVTSKTGAANENYARELMELFTMGVDNGYDQHDIEEMSRAWTGWRIDKLPLAQKNNPFASAVANRNTDPGYWTMRFSRSSHDTKAKTIFPGKTVDPRFGPPHAGKSYELKLPARTDTAGLQDGYDVITHLANLPYTQEYISVKLCQWFVHENFHHGLYNYTDPNLSPEAALVRDCMAAWEIPGPDGRKGNLRSILKTIFNSPLFRSQAASRQKVKTPMEFVISSIRALRAAKPTGDFTADSTGRDTDASMEQIGMRPFYREEPDGWPEFGRDWINTSSLVERMRYVQTLLRVGNRNADPVSLLKLKLPADQWRNPDAVADFFVTLLFPGEGKANLDLDRAAAVAFLNKNEAGTATSLFSGLIPTTAAYDTRVRGMVAMLMCLPRFQEQ